MEHRTDIESIIAPIKKFDFKIYSLESSKLLIFKEKFFLKELQLNTISHIPPKNLYWSFNDKSMGDYCRELSQEIQKITYSFPDIIKSFKDNSEKRRFIEVIYNDLNDTINENIVMNDQIKIGKNISIEKFLNPILETSLNKAYKFRKTKIIDLIKIIDNEHMNWIYPRLAAKKATAKKGGVAKRIVEKNENQPRVQMKGFCWNKTRNLIEDLVILHTYLREYDFIDKNTSIKTLQNALGCCFINRPLGIKWTKKVKGKLSKGLLFHFIDQLEHFNLINITYQNFELFIKLNLIFCGPSGDELKNLEVSKSQWLNQRKQNKTPQELALDNILYTLLYKESK